MKVTVDIMLSLKYALYCVLLLSVMDLNAITAAGSHEEVCVGCESKLSATQLEEASETLKFSLSKLAAGEGPVYR